ELADMRMECEKAVEPAPNLRAWDAARELKNGHLAQIRQGLVQRHPLDAFDRELVTQMRKEQGFVGKLLYDARLARCDLRDDGGDDRVPTPRDRGHIDDQIVVLERDVAV